MLISEQYRAEQIYLHTQHDRSYKYGTGTNYQNVILQIFNAYRCKNALDYGCGKAILAKKLPFEVQLYDPALTKYAALPNAADLVICIDVLEHVEPELLTNVLQHLKELSNKVLFVAIGLTWAGRILRDGRNAHLIIKPVQWWHGQFISHGMHIVRTYKSESRKPDWVAEITP